MLFERSNDGIIILQDRVIVDANSRVLIMFGCDRDDLLGKRIEDISPEYQHDGVRTKDRIIELAEKIKSGEPQRFQWVNLRPDGKQFITEVTLSLLILSQRDMVMVALRDVTKERLKAELFETMYRINPVAMMLTDLQTGLHLDVNDSYAAIFGFTPDEVKGKTSLELGIWVNPDDRECFVTRSGREGQVIAYEVLLRNKRGNILSMLMNSSVLRNGERNILLTMAQDVTRLREAEISLRTVFEESPFALIVTEPKTGVIIDVNNRCLEIMGYEREEVIGKRGRDFDNLADDTRSRLEALLDRDGRVDDEETILVREDGERRTILISTRIIQFEGRLAALNGLRDITIQKQAEQALRESEEKFSKLFSASPDFICLTEIESGLIFEANDSLRHLLGFYQQDLVGRTVFSLGLWVDANERARFVDGMRKNGECLGFSFQCRGRDGNVFPATISSKAIDFAGRKCMISIVRDMTEKVKLEEQLRHSQRMEAIGLLAGSVAHDFNNILTGIMGHVELAISKIGWENPAAANLDIVLDLANQATQLSHSLLAFSRKQAMNREPASINDIIRKSENLLRRLIGANIEFSVDLKEDATVIVDALQIEQVITNMVVNARDAMPNGGKLAIMTDIVYVDEFTARRYELEEAGRYVCLTISDTGIGMTKEVMDQIFDPFFTTKGVGKGTGLGLSVAYGIIKKHAGFISVDSDIGIGSKFRIFLLVASGVVRRREKSKDVEARGGSEVILIAEDDEVVRDLDRCFLEKNGYTVLDARDGEEALRIFTHNTEKIDLVILDVIMPKKNGKEVFDSIRLVKPTMKVLFISGYTDDNIDGSTDLGHGAELLLKPVSPRILLNKVRETLDRKG
jgi:PAS domain S-box-containing protein